MNTKTAIPAHIHLQGACNARDLGGYITSEGKTKRFSFIRCESPEHLTEQDITLLLKLGVRTVIDLRNMDEVQEAPGPFAQIQPITLHNIPLLNIDASPHALEGIPMGDLYVYMLDNCQPAFSRVFRTILTANRGVFFHCVAGKDRTGMVSALLLLLAGVHAGAVIEEYTYTQTLLAPWVEQEKARLAGTVSDADDMYDARPEYMQQALDHLEDRYGGIQGYLRTIGLSENEMEAIRHRLVGGQGFTHAFSRYSA